jgi:hypothetical protein
MDFELQAANPLSDEFTISPIVLDLANDASDAQRIQTELLKLVQIGDWTVKTQRNQKEMLRRACNERMQSVSLGPPPAKFCKSSKKM